jgi:hypothetical protein
MGTPSAELPPSQSSSAHTNDLALISLVTGILSFLGHIVPIVGGSTLAIVAIATGYMARNQIKQTGEQGMTMANVGMILGIANLALVALLVFLFIFFIFVLGIGVFGFAARNH